MAEKLRTVHKGDHPAFDAAAAHTAGTHAAGATPGKEAVLQAVVAQDADTIHAEEFRLAMTKAYGYAGTVRQLVMFAGDDSTSNTVYLFFK